jgi:hypothetical protein
MAKTVKIKMDKFWSDTKNQYIEGVEVQCVTNLSSPDNWQIAEALKAAGYLKAVGGSVPVWKYKVIG